MTDLKEKQIKELDMWNKWRKTGDNEELSKLVLSFQPIVNTTVNKYRAAPIPNSAIEAMSKSYLMDGLKTYQPGKGAALNTHLYNYQKGMYRWVTQHQNMVRLPEHRVRKVGVYTNAYNYLNDTLDREPTATELGEELDWDIKEVERMSKELVKDYIGEQHSDEHGLIGFHSFDDFGKNKEILEMVYYDLTPQEKLVYEYTYGVGGKPVRDTAGEIAREMNISPDRVRRLRNSISKKLEGSLK